MNGECVEIVDVKTQNLTLFFTCNLNTLIKAANPTPL